MKHKRDSKGKFIKVGVIVWTIDPENKMSFLIRHNRPYGGHDDEWTILFGNVETNETEEKAALRELQEEFGILKIENIKDLSYEIEFVDKQGLTIIKFFAIKTENIDTKITLNKESIGYDWMTIQRVKKIMQHDDEKKAFDILVKNKYT